MAATGRIRFSVIEQLVTEERGQAQNIYHLSFQICHWALFPALQSRNDKSEMIDDKCSELAPAFRETLKES
jgi:hypothetical protein